MCAVIVIFLNLINNMLVHRGERWCLLILSETMRKNIIFSVLVFVVLRFWFPLPPHPRPRPRPLPPCRPVPRPPWFLDILSWRFLRCVWLFRRQRTRIFNSWIFRLSWENVEPDVLQILEVLEHALYLYKHPVISPLAMVCPAVVSLSETMCICINID